MISFPAILLRLGLALVLGALVGLERERGEHTAGLRTLALVSLGSSLFTIISAFGFLSFLSTPHIQIDPTRIASYIVAGIGFLGAGVIFVSREKERVKGLTTAAAIWLVAAVGLACGAGLLLEAVATTVLALVVLVSLRYVERLLLPRQSLSTHHLHIEADSVAGELIGNVYDVCTRSGVTVEKLGIHTEQVGKKEVVEVVCCVADVAKLAHVLAELHALPEVRAVHGKVDGSGKQEN